MISMPLQKSLHREFVGDDPIHFGGRPPLLGKIARLANLQRILKPPAVGDHMDEFQENLG